ncbi:MAG TPA: hypothetical protein VFR70_03110, partial [Flavobacterium sp.]|nr:hypothetical protein [Flavobacterium sp.]
MIINRSILSDNAGNDIRASKVTAMDNKIGFCGFSAKYVHSGSELYVLNNKKHKISSGEYVVGNKNTEATILIDSPVPVKGICIDISEEKINEIIDFSFSESESFKRFIFEEEWAANRYHASNTNLGHALNQIAHRFEQAGSADIHSEIFYSIAECIVKDQKIVYSQFQSLKAVKEETNKRLFNFVYDAKN